MTHPVASDEEQGVGEDDDGRAVAVKEDPQFTLAVTRGQSLSGSKLHKGQARDQCWRKHLIMPTPSTFN